MFSPSNVLVHRIVSKIEPAFSFDGSCRAFRPRGELNRSFKVRHRNSDIGAMGQPATRARRVQISPSLLTWALTTALIGAALGLHAVIQSRAANGGLLDNAVGAVVLVALFAMSEVLVIHVRLGQSAHSVSVVEGIVVIALLHSSPTITMFAVSLGTAGTLIGFRRQSILKASFNTASYALGSQLAWAAFLWLPTSTATHPSTWGAALVAAAVFACTAAFLVWVVICVHDQNFRFKSLADGLQFALGTSALTTACGVVAAILAKTAPLASPLMILPILGAYMSNVLYARERRRAEELNFLQRSSESVLSEEVQSSAVRAMIDQAVRELRIQYIEVEFEDDGSLKRFAASSDGTNANAENDSLEGGLVAAMPSAPTLRKRGDVGADQIGDAIRARSLASAVVAPIHVGETPIGAIMLGDRAASVFTLGPEDVRVAETLASHIAMVVENSKLKRSVGDLRDLERQLVSELQHDALTGLLNRSAFIRQTRDMLGGHTEPSVAVMFIDLDDFKRVNDSSGHAAGDALLREVADRLRAAIRPGDIAARLGGDEFAVLLTRTTHVQDAQSTATRVSAALSRPFAYNGTHHPAGASIGVALPLKGDDYVTLAERADTAMYRAKAAGKGTIETIDPRTDEADQRAKQLVNDLRRSLERQELQVDFQPVVSLRTQEILSFEALVRWQHPTLGLLQPEAFLKVGHDQSSLSALDDFVLDQALLALSKIDSGSPGCAISVNLRAAQLSDNRMLASLEHRSHADRSAIQFEVAVQDLERSTEATTRCLAALRSAGFGIVIDDLTIDSVGFRNLEMIRPTQVKLARSVTQRLDQPATMTIVRSIVSVGHDLGFTVALKGVETAAEDEAAKAAGCSAGQGFLYSRPFRLDQLDSVGAFASETRASSVSAAVISP